MTATLLMLRRLLIGINSTGAGAMMAAVFLIVFTNAFWRYTVGRFITWGEDIAIFAMIFGIMFGVALAYLQDRHVRLSIIVDLLPKHFKHFNLVLVDVLVLFVGIGLAVSGYEFMDSRGSRVSPSTGLPMWMFQSSMLMGGVLLSLSAITMAALRLFDTTGAKVNS